MSTSTELFQKLKTVHAEIDKINILEKELVKKHDAKCLEILKFLDEASDSLKSTKTLIVDFDDRLDTLEKEANAIWNTILQNNVKFQELYTEYNTLETEYHRVYELENEHAEWHDSFDNDNFNDDNFNDDDLNSIDQEDSFESEINDLIDQAEQENAWDEERRERDEQYTNEITAELDESTEQYNESFDDHIREIEEFAEEQHQHALEEQERIEEERRQQMEEEDDDDDEYSY